MQPDVTFFFWKFLEPKLRLFVKIPNCFVLLLHFGAILAVFGHFWRFLFKTGFQKITYTKKSPIGDLNKKIINSYKILNSYGFLRRLL